MIRINSNQSREPSRNTSVETSAGKRYLIVAFDFRDVERLGGPVARDFDLFLLVEPDELGGGRLDEILQHLQISQPFVALHHQIVVRFLDGCQMLVVDGGLFTVEFALFFFKEIIITVITIIVIKMNGY